MEKDERHNLNNVLSSIANNAALLMQDLLPGTAQHKFARAIFDGAGQAMDFINKEKTIATKALVNKARNHSVIDKKRLLVVDDQPDILEVMKIMLERGGYDVAVCADSDAMTAALQDDAAGFDLVILDVSLPGESGYDVASRLSKAQPHLPVLLVSGHKKEDVRSLAQGIANVRDIVEKAVLTRDLVKTVDQIFS